MSTAGSDGLYKPDGSKVWYGRYWDHQKGDWVYRSTRCRDRAAARIIRDQWERDAADPRAAAAARATLSEAITERLKELTSMSTATPPKRAGVTVDFFSTKSGHLIRILEHDEEGKVYTPLKLSALEPPHGAVLVDRYIERRRLEWALPPISEKRDEEGKVVRPARVGRHISDHTIHKELVCLRSALKLAKRRGLWQGDITAVLPIGFSPSYEPVRRWLTLAEAKALIGELTPDRGARVAFMLAAASEWGPTDRALRTDLNEERGEVLVTGTKTKYRYRNVAMLFAWQRELLKFAKEKGEGKDGLLFQPWGNCSRDIHTACARAGIPKCSPNDLRRTCLTWLRAEGMRPSEIGPYAGHADSRMVEKVYAKLDPDQLRAVMLGQAAQTVTRRAEGSSTGSGTGVDSAGFMGPMAQPRTANPAELVPRGGIEPPTRGFSVQIQIGLTSRTPARSIEERRLALVPTAPLVGGKAS